MIHIDKTYAGMISSRLERFKWQNKDTAIFRCPICGDSKRNKAKCRGGFYTLNDKLMVGCFNCGYNKPFSIFLKKLDPVLYKQYVFESYKYNNDHRWFNQKIEKQEQAVEPIKIPELWQHPESTLQSLRSIAELDFTHPAKHYVLTRKIPSQFWNKIFYTENYKKWVNTCIIADKFKNVDKQDPRIVIPFYGASGKPFAYQGRYIGTDPNEERYISINPDSNLLVYGIDRLEAGQIVYIVEGPIDSMFLPNCLAVAGSGLQKLIKYKIKSVFIFDNEPRNPQICALMEKVIAAGKDIVIWPTSPIKKEDINSMVLAGKNVLDIIQNNTYNGILATIKYNEWKKI